MVSLSRKTLHAARVALQRCPILHTGKRRIMIHSLRAFVNRLRRLETLPFVAVCIPVYGGLITP